MKSTLLRKFAQAIDVVTKEELRPLNSLVKIPLSLFKPKIKILNIQLVESIIDTLNSCIFYISNGKIDFAKLINSNFSLDTTSITHEYAKDVLRLCHLFYQYIHYGNDTIKKMLDICNYLIPINNKYLTSHLGGNFNSKIKTYIKLLDDLDLVNNR